MTWTLFKLVRAELRIGAEQMGAGDDRRERRAQFVAERGEEFVLQARGLVQLLVFVLEFLRLQVHALLQAGIGVAQGLLLAGKALVFFLEFLLGAHDVFGHGVEGLAEALDFVAGTEVGPGGVIAALHPPHHARQRLDRPDDRVGQRELDEDGEEADRADQDPHEGDAPVGLARFLV